MTRTMPAGVFKARCLKVMDEVKKGRKEVVITKHGVPVAKLVPVEERPADVFDCMAGTGRIAGDILSPVVSADDWELLE
jgi:prevent-host-death family protein